MRVTEMANVEIDALAVENARLREMLRAAENTEHALHRQIDLLESRMEFTHRADRKLRENVIKVRRYAENHVDNIDKRDRKSVV